MSRKEIKSFIENTLSILKKVPDKILQDYVIEEFEVPTHMLWEINYTLLKENHRQATNYITSLRNKPEYSEELEDLIWIRSILSMNILFHSLDKGSKGMSKFENEDEESLHLNQFPVKQKPHFRTLIKLYQLIIGEKRLRSNDRSLFISLLMDSIKQPKKILWLNYESDLRGFLTALIETNIIRYDATDLNQFAALNFVCLNRKKELKEINPDIFRTYQTQNSFHTAKKFWKEKLLQLR